MIALANRNGTAETTVAPPQGAYTKDVTVTYHVLAENDPHAGQRIGIALAGTEGIQVLFDNVRLSAKPPATSENEETAPAEK